ncbi:FUSC family protein [Clostridium sp. D46t1_190503_E9]|uniref:FUSC family protein n=1 Tax=Clostridium sp. D46t1_190503_E9 TaxID=2787137 RepID=UPI00189B10B9|nr:FUSC family protein [Clostridium sp. D46t1_190503_E9]
MDKKKIISNTIIFIFIISFISLFKVMFGQENTLVGVTVITAALTLMERDLTIAPFKNFIKVLLVNLFSLLFSVLAIQNIWIGIFINFIALFIIGYLFSYNLKKSIVVPFGLQYFFMLFYPAYGEVLFNRFLSLIFGAVFVMIVQFVVNRDRIFTTGGKILDGISGMTLSKITLIKENKNFQEENIKIGESINSLKRIIYDKRVQDYYLTNDASISTDILWALERINILLDSINNLTNKEIYGSLLDDIYREVEIIKNRDFTSSNINIFKNKMYDKEIDNYYVEEFTNLIRCLNDEFEHISDLNRREKDSIKRDYEIPHHFHNIYIHKKNFNIDSAKVRYSIRLGIIGSITVFLTQYFNLSEGRWMAFTIFSLIQPYSEISKTRIKERVEGTLIGVVIVLIAFSLIKNQAARGAILLVVGYLNPFANGYRNTIVLVTISAIASAAITGGTIKLALYRIIFVIVGAVLTIFADKYILPYKIKDANKYLVETYDSIIKQMIEDLSKVHSDYSIRNLYLITGFIEDKMKITMFQKEFLGAKEFLENRKMFVNNIYDCYINMSNGNELDYNKLINGFKLQ